MLYFKTLPKIVSPDQNGNIIVLTNLLTRAKLIEEMQNNPMLFYKYSVQEGDTPEIVADKYYGDSYRYWIVLYSNQILDPLWDWPLNYNEFISFLNVKYADVATANNQTVNEYLQSTVYEYQKVISTTDLETGTVSVETSSLSETDYYSLEASTETYTLPNNTQCQVSIDKNIIYLNDYENNLNESKREIKLLDSYYALQMEEQLYKVMSA